MSYNYFLLSPSEFEILAADILSAVHAVKFERFGEGPDGGIDCRHVSQNGGVWIGQAKRYKNTSELLRVMQDEQKKMLAQTPTPARYFLVTACSLSPANKTKLMQTMQPFIVTTADIYGAEDLDALLSDYPALYRKHHRLWLHSIEQLNLVLHQAHYVRAKVIHQRLISESKYYVTHNAQQTCSEKLAVHHSCLLVGEPGIGKSITAGQVALRYLLDNQNTELIWVDDRNFNQVLQLIRPESEQLIVLDDFLGATFLHDNGIIAFKRNWQALLHTAEQSNGKLKLLFITRNYILEQTLAQIDDDDSLITQLCQQQVAIVANNAKFRAELVYSLIRKTNLNVEKKAELIQKKLYWLLIKASNFSPRLMQMLCSQLTNTPSAELASDINAGLQGQYKLWQQVFKRLSVEAQTLLYVCAIAGAYACVSELKRAFNTLYLQIQGRIAPFNSFDNALIELEPTFIYTEQHLNDIWLNPINPSVIDFLHTNIADNSPLIEALINSIEHFDWGLDNFQLNTSSNHPIAISKQQYEQLLTKLVELLAQPGSNLYRVYSDNSNASNNGNTVKWVNNPDTFGAKLTKLWRTVMHNQVRATLLFQKISPQLSLLENCEGWQALFIQGGMQELLDITRYLTVEQQTTIWQLALSNLHNSEDAAALAEFYQQQPAGKNLFNKQKKKFNKILVNTCAAEVGRTNDPDHLEAIMNDLFRIEDATEANIKAVKLAIYAKIHHEYYPEDDNDFYENNSETQSYYYQRPDNQKQQQKLARQFILFEKEIDELFFGLTGITDSTSEAIA